MKRPAVFKYCCPDLPLNFTEPSLPFITSISHIPDNGENALRGVFGVAASAAVLLSYRCGLFEFLAAGPRDPGLISQRMGVAVDDVRHLLKTLTRLGLLRETSSGAVGLQLGLSPYLVPGGDAWHGPLFEFMGAPWNTTRAHDLMKSISDDAPVVTEDLWASAEQASAAKALLNLARFAVLWPVGLAFARSPLLSDVRQIVDLEGRSDGMLIPLMMRHPQLQAVVVDLEPSEHFERKVEACAFQERLQYARVDTLQSPISKDVDIVFLSQVLQSWDAERSRAVLAHVAAGLRRDARLVILERLLHDDDSGPLLASLQGLMTLMWRRGHQYRESEMKHLLAETGFTVSAIHPTMCVFSMIEARKQS